MNKKLKKDFDPILDDYAFFEAHATEAENDLLAYARHLPTTIGRKGTIQILDFGAGTGTFTKGLLRRTAWPGANLKLTLVEPGENALKQALKTLLPFSNHPISAYPLLPRFQHRFDIILANHVLYYVPDLSETVTQLWDLLSAGGRLLVTLAGRENMLIKCWACGFGMIKTDIPHFTAEDLITTLNTLGIPHQRQKVSYSIEFPDSRGNRMKILRFLYGKQLPAFPLSPLLDFFDQYSTGRSISLETHHYLFVILK